MRSLVPVIIGLFLPVAVAAQSVVDILPAPVGAWGIDYYDGSLWVGDDRDGFLYQIDPSDGAILDVISTPYDENHIPFGCNHGVAWDGTGFWIAGDYNKDWLYKIDTDGTTLETIPSPTAAVGGLSWDGMRLVVTTYYPDGTAGILKVDPSDGSVEETIPTQGTQPYGVAYVSDDDTVWNAMNDNDGDPENIWHLEYADGTPISHFDCPGPEPKGLALGGGYMWLIADEVGGYDPEIYKIDLSGGGNGDITVIPSEHDFGIIPLGSPGSYNQTIRNDGDADLTLTAITTADPFSHEPVALPYTLTPDESLGFMVTFDPAMAGSYAGSLVIESDDVDEPVVTIPLRGTAVFPDPTIDVMPVALYFYDTGVGLVRARELSIANVGYLPLTVTGIESDDAAFLPPDLTFPIVLATFDTLRTQVIFRPAEEIDYAGVVTISSNDPDDPMVLRNAVGEGIMATFAPGEPIWSAQGIENVVCVLEIPDVTADGLPDAIMESYDAGADGDPHVAFWGNSHGDGVEIWSTGTSGGYGDQCLALIDDLDDDGYAEVLRGTAWGGRSVEVRGSEDGELLWSFDTHIHQGGGWVYGVHALADVSGDGLPEVLVAVGAETKRLYCLDGASGDQRFSLYAPDGFLTTTSIEDVNDDGHPDVVAGNGGNYEDDRVFCISGASVGAATVIWDYHTGGSVWSVDVIGDVSGDGINDVLAGSWSNSVFCLNGVTGGLIWERPVGASVMRVEAMEDVTGDGKEDVVTAILSSRIITLDGVSGGYHWTYPTGGSMWAASWIPDVNGDGRADVIAGGQDNRVYCIGGVNGELIWSRNVGATVYSVRSIGDVNGSRYPDVLAGTQMVSGSGGEIWCLEGGAVPLSSVEEPEDGTGAFARFLGPARNPMLGEGAFLIHASGTTSDDVVLNLFDPTGRRIRTLSTHLSAGVNRLHWDGRDANGLLVPSGTYLYRIAGAGPAGRRQGSSSGKLTLIR